MVEDMQITVPFVRTDDNVADIFTKKYSNPNASLHYAISLWAQGGLIGSGTENHIAAFVHMENAQTCMSAVTL